MIKSKGYKGVDLYQGKILNFGSQYVEMREHDYRFLLGLIEMFSPKKIVEVGVAAGITSAVILNYLMQTGKTSSCLIDIDKSEKYYWDSKKFTGFWCEDWKKRTGCQINHETYHGCVSAEVVEEIGNGIDFLFLDTTHFLPGELLDFLVFLPFLADDGVVVLHDTALSHVQLVDERAIATKILFDVVTAEKFYMEDTGYGNCLSNIAAFRINKETKDNIIDVFSALMIGWDYLPELHDMYAYKKIIQKEYDNICNNIFSSTLSLQCESLPVRRIPQNYRGDFADLKKKWITAENVYIYGCGKWGRLYYYYALNNSLKIQGMVVSTDDDVKKYNAVGYNCPILSISELIRKDEEISIVYAMSYENYRECRELLNGYEHISEL